MEITNSFKKNRIKIFLIVIALNILVIFSLLQLNNMSDRFVHHNKHLVYSITNIKYIATQSHLWLEEYLNGDKKEFSKINIYLQEAKREINILKNGGLIRNNHFENKNNDSTIKKYLKSIDTKLNKFDKLINQRIDSKQKTGSSEDESFDLEFDKLINEIESLDKYIYNKFQKMYKRYETIKSFTFITIFILIIVGILLIKKLNSKIENSLDIINKQSEQLKQINSNLEKDIKEQTRINTENLEKLYQQEKLLSMTNLITNIAHHWRQPLTYISACASSISLGLTDKKDLDEHMKNIVKKTNDLSKVIDYFTESIENKDKLASFTIEELILNIENLIIPNLKSNNIEIKTTIAKSDQVITTYKSCLISILLSILNNAKEVLIKREIKDKYITLDAYTNDDQLIIKITDNAGGIEQNLLDKIIEPYFTTNHQSFNKGLSLYLNYDEIKKKLNGDFEIKNNSIGAEFTIKLPINR